MHGGIEVDRRRQCARDCTDAHAPRDGRAVGGDDQAVGTGDLYGPGLAVDRRARRTEGHQAAARRPAVDGDARGRRHREHRRRDGRVVDAGDDQHGTVGKRREAGHRTRVDAHGQRGCDVGGILQARARGVRVAIGIDLPDHVAVGHRADPDSPDLTGDRQGRRFRRDGHGGSDVRDDRIARREIGCRAREAANEWHDHHGAAFVRSH